MKVVFTDDHRLHFAQGEISGGEFVTPFERPSRMEYILRELKKRKMYNIVPPKPLDMRAVAVALRCTRNASCAPLGVSSYAPVVVGKPMPSVPTPLARSPRNRERGRSSGLFA